MSQFDALLEFNDNSGGSGNVQKSPDFDPFGPSDVKGSSDSDLLADFGFPGQTATTNGNSNGQSVNPLYELSMDNDFNSSESNNLIMSDDFQVSQKPTKSTDPFGDFENEKSAEPSVNPLYDLSDDKPDTNGHDIDLLGLDTKVVVTDESGDTVETSNKGDNLLLNGGGDNQELHFEVRRDESRDSVNVISDEDSELVENFTEAEKNHIIQESQEILQNQNPNLETEAEQRQISFEDQPAEPEVLVFVPEEDQTEVSQREDQTEEPVNTGLDQQPIETEEIADDTPTEPEQQEIIEIKEVTQVDPDVPVIDQEPVVIPPEVNLDIDTTNVEPVETEEPVQEEQEVIPTEEFDMNGSYEEEKDTTESNKMAAGQKQGSGETVTESVVQNGLDEGVFRETNETEEIRFDQMSSIKNKYESGESDEIERERKKSVHEEIAGAEGGEYENEPVRNPDVIRESDKDIGAELPEVGTAKNILEKFKQIQTTPKSYKRETTPPEVRKAGKVEYVSEPKPSLDVPEAKVEGGIFENQPVVEEDVVHSYDAQEEALPEKGTARNILERFKQIQTGTSEGGSKKFEIQADRNSKVEYVSEPRTVMEKYEGKVESGIFESKPTEELPDIIRSGMANEEVLPEKGTAKSLASRYKEYSEKAASPHVSERKRELTPDKTGKVEYVSEPRATLEKYEGKSEAGVFESKPEDKEEIVKSDMQMEEILPEKGAARNIAAKFREIASSNTPSPTSSPKPKFKEVTPPRDDVEGKTVAGVLESTPVQRGDIVKSSDVHDVVHEEELPERGMAKNIANRFRQIQQSSGSPTSSSRGKKEFTPPPDKGVFENTPTPSLQIDVRQAESGILESTPSKRDDVARENEYSAGDVEFPESGYAKNMVSKWKQIESKSGQSTPSPRAKEFTPPRDFPLSPKSPAGVDSSVQPSDLPGQYQEQGRPGIYENQPSTRYDVAREGESEPEPLPEKDAAKNMVQKFKALQEQAKKAEEVPKPVSRKDSSDSSNSPSNTSTKPKGSFVPVQLEKCAACQKTVYAMEKLEMNKNIYHRGCFKCSHCKCVLTAKTFSMNEGVIYCTNHFKQLFARKGNYDEGFGRQQYKKKWAGDTNSEEQ